MRRAAVILALITLVTFAPAARGANLAEHYGISIGAPVHNGQVTFTEQVAQDLAAMRVRWIRVEFIAYGDTIDYTQYDEIINRANAYDLEVLGLLTYQTKNYSYNSSNWAVDAWQDSFRDRCVEVVNHYRDFASGPIRFWEVWNEPDSMGYMAGAKFGRLLSVCYPAIKAADPHATVISGGLTGYSTPTYTYMFQAYNSTYMQNYKAAHGIYPFDILGLHPYNWTADPNAYLAQQMNGSNGLRKLLNSFGDNYKRIWFTEYGWNSSSTAPSSVNPGGSQATNEARQADYFEHAITIAQPLTYASGTEYGPYVEKTFLFQYKDFDIGTQEWFGTVDQSYRRKPLFERYAALTAEAWVNAALTAAVTASGATGPAEAAGFACDGTPFTRWSSSTPADDHTLTLELDRWYRVHEFRVVHAEMGHGSDVQNTRAFTIESSPTGAAPWTVEFTVSNGNRQPLNILPLENPKAMRYLRLHVSDAGEADGFVRLPEFEVWGEALTDAPSFAAVQREYALDITGAGGLSLTPDDDDLIAGQLAAFESGDVDPANGVFAYEFDAGLCLAMTATPLSGFWHGYSDPSPAAHLAKFTDGGIEGVVLRDFGRAAAVLRYDFASPQRLRDIVVFARNPGRDGRVFQHYDVYVSTNGGVDFEPLYLGVRTGPFGSTNPGTYGASFTRVYSAVPAPLAEHVDSVRLVFYDTHIGDTFFDPWQSNTGEGASYQVQCPTQEPDDADGLRKAFSSPILVEIDMHAVASGDFDADGDVDLADFAAFVACLSGPADLPDGGCAAFDFPPGDGVVDLRDGAALLRAVSAP